MGISRLTKIWIYFSLLLCLSTVFSCTTSKRIKYFEDIPDSGALKGIDKIAYVEPKIQVDDILTILVQTVDPTATQAINSGNIPITNTGMVNSGGGVTPAASAASAGMLVEKDGTVEIPVLGKIKLAGLTTTEAKEVIRVRANKFYTDPTVIVRFANFKISVTGEVARPGTYVLPNEKVSFMDAISMAGDLTIYAKRENVLLVRENADGTKTPYRINLRKSSSLSSPIYYLKQNDFIYVEPGKGKAAANDAAQARTFALLGSFISVLIVVVSRINF